MKIKRFNNLWTMGLIIFGALLVGFYVLKIVCPQFIVGVAEIPSVVKFGNFVDSHWWAIEIYKFVLGFFGCYILFCACCKVRFLGHKDTFIVALYIILIMISQRFLIGISVQLNYVLLVLTPFIILLLNKKLTKETFISTIVCFSVDIMSQALSMQIRNIVMMSSLLNSATMTILMIDGYIWRILLYLFFNYNKGGK